MSLYKRPQSSRPLRVEGFIATPVSADDRGPQVRIRTEDARVRMLEDGELVWVEGPRRQQLAKLVVDDSVPRGGVVVRDIASLAPSEVVYIIKPDFDTPPQSGRYA